MKTDNSIISPVLNADRVWINLLDAIINHGQVVTPRNMKCMELNAMQSCVDMSYPVLTIPERRLGYKFMAAEASWILSGDNKVNSIKPYSPVIERFSDDGLFFNGAYGPRIIDQLTYVCDTLIGDMDSRQAVLTIWRPNPRPSADIPCTVAIQFLVRDGVLHCIDTMRSSDVWLGWPYDIFNFTMLSSYVCLLIKHRTGLSLKLGTIILQAGSQHLYFSNLEEASKIVQKYKDSPLQEPVIPYRKFDPVNEFPSPQALIDYLKLLKDHYAPDDGPFTEVCYASKS